MTAKTRGLRRVRTPWQIRVQEPTANEITRLGGNSALQQPRPPASPTPYRSGVRGVPERARLHHLSLEGVRRGVFPAAGVLLGVFTGAISSSSSPPSSACTAPRRGVFAGVLTLMRGAARGAGRPGVVLSTLFNAFFGKWFRDLGKPLAPPFLALRSMREAGDIIESVGDW